MPVNIFTINKSVCSKLPQFENCNQINKVQWVDFKLENVLVSLHSLKTMDLGPFGASAPLFLRNGERWILKYVNASLIEES
jgi:aminoglycoside phosphotransferase (APT) family kinase protein